MKTSRTATVADGIVILLLVAIPAAFYLPGLGRLQWDAQAAPP
jgi:hypothetical protein